VQWKDKFIPKIKDEVEELEANYRERERPIFRSMWYILVSKYPKIIPNTSSMYSSYDKAISKARRGEYGVVTKEIDYRGRLFC
jgi:hypothetical protein